VFQQKRLRDDGTDTAGSEQADQGSKETDEKNHQLAHRRIVARRAVLRNHGRNNNSPATGGSIQTLLEVQGAAMSHVQLLKENLKRSLTRLHYIFAGCLKRATAFSNRIDFYIKEVI
jgi:hypothetical protein